MPKAFVLMTAMPPTNGHLQLIQFANLLAPDGTTVIISTQPHEPMTHQRVAALRAAIQRCGLTRVTLKHFDKTIEQDPSAPGFWQMWRELMLGFGITPSDYIVASEVYGKKLADIVGAQFFPYDIERAITATKATLIRDNPLRHFTDIIPEFQPYLRTTVTVFGAESTGKTTLSRRLAHELRGHWLFEYARPYLENTMNEITPRSMRAIWHGQAALQRQADNLTNKAFVVQDTDLFSTVGYWQLPHWQSKIGACPTPLIDDAQQLQSDLYIITKSNIPFEQDPLRYGGNIREGSDEYWISLCKNYNLPYVVLENSAQEARLLEAVTFAQQCARAKMQQIAYDRQGL